MQFSLSKNYCKKRKMDSWLSNPSHRSICCVTRQLINPLYKNFFYLLQNAFYAIEKKTDVRVDLR